MSRQVSSTASLRRTSTPVSSAVSTAHVVESTDVSAFPAEVIDVKTGVEEPPVAVQATAPFLPAAEKEIVRDVTEKRLLHRVLSRHRAQIDFGHGPTSSQTETISLLYQMVSLRGSIVPSCRTERDRW